MALAYGGPYYMSPVNVRKMAHDLSALPMWYAPTGADVWMSEDRQIEWMRKQCPLSLDVNGVTELYPNYNKICPWGWSTSIAYRLQQQGIGNEGLPSVSQLETIRTLSARGMALKVLHQLDYLHPFVHAASVQSIREVEYMVEKHGKVLLKAPWSGSGRGIQCVETVLTDAVIGWINHMLRTQEYIVVEPYYNKVVDFAMEFLAENGKVTFVGYSWFETDDRGLYKENLLAGDAAIHSRLTTYVPEPVLREICCSLEECLSEVIGCSYQGYLGVDMMLCRVDGGGFAVHPCVEINLRMNMGMTARLLFDRYVFPLSEGRFVIEYYHRVGEALRVHESMLLQHPLSLKDGRIKQGYLSLTPVFEDTSYQAFVCVNG